MPLKPVKTATSFPRKVKEIENLFITLADGTKLAARMWLPSDAEKNPVPALLEYLPYRKRDGTHVRDALTHPYLAGHGYACIRVDMRGNGDSEGLMRDEYLRQEQDDAVEVIEWLAEQKWCDGKVGMFGISWGGFNALQVAALKPAALKAIVSICSTDDRYEDDIHYKGGTLLNENLGWAATMLAYSSRPPDPEIVGKKWRKMWMERLENEPFLLTDWLKHPHRDAYWKHGSICEGFAKIEAATLLVGGWNDAYSNAVPRMMKGLRCPRKAIIGPWAHKYPHFAVPGPRIGFLQEMLRWWDHHLKGVNTKIMDEPDYRYYIMDAYRPGSFPEEIKGRWVGDPYWGYGNMSTKTWYLTSKGIAGEKAVETNYAFTSKQNVGFDGGEYCIIWLGEEFPGDQRKDDAGSITFDSPPLGDDLDIVGQPVLKLSFSVDKPVANIAVRLNDIWPDGAVSRISYQLQNLCMKDSREFPTPLEPGKRYTVRVKLDDIAWRVPKGHKIRVSVSPTYFPLMWPAPEPVTLTLYAGGANSVLEIPVRKMQFEEKPVIWTEAEAAKAVALKDISNEHHKREVTTDTATNVTKLEIVDDFGTQVIKDIDLTIGGAGRETYTINANDPLSAKMETHWTETRKRGSWDIRTETYGRLTATTTDWIVWGKIEAFEGKKLVFTKEFNEKIPRQLQ